MLTEGADKVGRQLFSYILITADGTAPDGLALVRLLLLRATEMRSSCMATCAMVLLIQLLSRPPSQVVMTNRPY